MKCPNCDKDVHVDDGCSIMHEDGTEEFVCPYCMYSYKIN